MKKRFWICLMIILILQTALHTSAEGTLSRVVDEADFLTTEEEEILTKKLDEISERQQCDVVVVTAKSLQGKTAEAYADDYYDGNGYGFGEQKDGILFLVCPEERDWHISTRGYGILAFTDAGLEYMSDKIVPYLSQENYNQAFLTYANYCDDYLTQAKTGEPYDVDNLPKGKVSPWMIPVNLVIGFVAAFVSTKSKASKLKTVKKQKAAENYMVPGSQILTVSYDRFLRKEVNQRMVSKSDSSSGGSKTHTSSSGATHGGTGGKY